MAAKKGVNFLIKGKKTNWFSLRREKGRNQIQKALLEKYGEHDGKQAEHIRLKRIVLWYAVVCYPMVWYGMTWCGVYGMTFILTYP